MSIFDRDTWFGRLYGVHNLLGPRADLTLPDTQTTTTAS